MYRKDRESKQYLMSLDNSTVKAGASARKISWQHPRAFTMWPIRAMCSIKVNMKYFYPSIPNWLFPISSTGATGDQLDLQVAMAPCLLGYGEIGVKLYNDPNTKRGKYVGQYNGTCLTVPRIADDSLSLMCRGKSILDLDQKLCRGWLSRCSEKWKR